MGFIDNIIGRSEKVIIGEIAIDASVREVHDLEGTLTEHPVEKGADVADHYRVLPVPVVIEGVISNTPIVAGYPFATAVNAGRSVASGDGLRGDNAWGEVKKLFENKEVIDITTSLESYTDMVLISFSVERDALDRLKFIAVAKKIRFVSTQFVDAVTDAADTAAQQSKKRGKQNNKDANATQETSSSGAFKGFKGLGLIG